MQNNKTHIHCSYCGGCDIDLIKTSSGEAVPVIKHLLLTAPNYGVKEAFNLAICVWCWRKVFDAVLGPTIPTDVRTQA